MKRNNRIEQTRRRVATRIPVTLTHWEILNRARADIMRELEALAKLADEEGLPDVCYSDDRAALEMKLSIISAMLCYETGESCSS